jgi:cell division protease FtsH
MDLPENEKQSTDRSSKKEKKFSWWWMYIFILISLIITSIISKRSTTTEITWQQFENEIIGKRVIEKIIVINGERADVYIDSQSSETKITKQPIKQLNTSSKNRIPNFSFTIGSLESFERKLESLEKNKSPAEKIKVSYIKQGNWVLGIAGWLLPIILMIGVWFFIINRTRGNDSSGTSLFNFGRSNATLIEKEKSNINFDDVAGLEEAEMEVREIVEFLKNPGIFTKLGAKIPKGVILVGAPGTGKTLLAKAVAGEAQVPFFSISGSEFVEMFVGVGASRVRDLFNKAKAKAPCIVFIDEIDAIGRSRGKGTYLSGANDERESTLNQLLTEMDGFGTNSGVIVLAATNRADMLDPALLRPGRFDRHIYLELPNLNEREEIFKVHLKPLVLDDKINTHFLASQTPGFSGADIANICNEAALIAARNKKNKIDSEDFMNAIDRIVAGIEKKSKIITPDEKKIIAYHEAGHAVVSWLLKRIDPLIKVSIIPRGKSLGSAWYLPEEKQLRSKATFKEHLVATLGGRASEEIIFGDISSGALDDLEKATKEAYMMVSIFGFNEKIGNVSFYDSTGQRDAGIQKPYGEQTENMIDEEVRKLIDTAYTQSKIILEQNKVYLIDVVESLIKKEIIFSKELEEIMGSRNKDENIIELEKVQFNNK